MSGQRSRSQHDGRQAALLWHGPQRPPELYVVEIADGEGAPADRQHARRPRPRPRWSSRSSSPTRPSTAARSRPGSTGRRGAAARRSSSRSTAARKRRSGRLPTPLYQYLLSRGIGVLAPNIRGSTGYGKTYQTLIHRDWGGGDLQDFEHAAVPARARLGRPRADRRLRRLLRRLRHPLLRHAAARLLGGRGRYRRAVQPGHVRQGRAAHLAAVHGPVGRRPRDRGRLPDGALADHLRRPGHAPLFVIQGANDPRVVKGESDQIVERLRERGVDVSYDVYEDEGHGFTKRENELRAYRLRPTGSSAPDLTPHCFGPGAHDIDAPYSRGHAEEPISAAYNSDPGLDLSGRAGCSRVAGIGIRIR